MSKKRTFKEGQRVVLKANPKEGWKREEGVIDGPSGPGVWMVTVDRKYRLGQDDDGIREVTADQIE